jgi:hypothetical protein
MQSVTLIVGRGRDGPNIASFHLYDLDFPKHTICAHKSI